MRCTGPDAGYFIAHVRSQLDTTIRSGDQAVALLGVAALATVPRLDVELDGARLLTHATSPAADAFGTLRTNPLFSGASRGLPTIAITSAAPGEGKTTVATNVAASLALQGLRVLLIDADLRRPAVHTTLGLPREPGLVDGQ